MRRAKVNRFGRTTAQPCPGARAHRRRTRSFAVLVAASLVVAGAMVATAPAAGATSAYDPASDPYSMYNTTSYFGVPKWWDAGYTGMGVDVAVIDTGVSPVEGLSDPGKIVYGPDLSLESQAPNLQYLDTNGHGTFMAGLIAGRDSSLTAPYAAAPASAYRGVAPDARILSVKVGIADGGVDVSQVIAAIDWVVQHRNDNGLNVRIINLSYGTNSKQSYVVDPLAFAVEQAWKKGIVVVAPAGNTGYQRGNDAPGLADPGYDPFVIGVGGYDPNGTPEVSDDTMGGYSASSAGCRRCKNPDFVAIGSHLQGLRVPNSYVDLGHPGGRIDDRYFRGSGTSEAAAMTSGAIALILQKYPALTPDQVKGFIQGGTRRVPGADSQAQGDGELYLKALALKSPSQSTQTFTPSTGIGSLEATRGLDHLTLDGVVLSGEQDIFGGPFNSAAMAALEAAGISWSGGTWNGNTWSGNTWSGNTWSGTTWSGNTWSGNTWSGNTWSGNTWSGNTWSGNTWSGNTWSGNTWSGNTWSGSRWMGATWD
jgi:serine protease AprX